MRNIYLFCTLCQLFLRISCLIKGPSLKSQKKEGVKHLWQNVTENLDGCLILTFPHMKLPLFKTPIKLNLIFNDLALMDDSSLIQKWWNLWIVLFIYNFNKLGFNQNISKALFICLYKMKNLIIKKTSKLKILLMQIRYQIQKKNNLFFQNFVLVFFVVW